MANANLLGMPLELLVHIIATYLPTQDLGALRLTCKELDKSLFDTFAKEFFTKKQFMVSSHSLGTLIEISEHPVFSTYLNHVIIGLDNYQSLYHIPNQPDQIQAFRDGCADQLNLQRSGRGRDMLAQAFRNLPNLKTLGIRDYDAMGRLRDGTRWRSYGVSTIRRQTGLTLGTYHGGSASDYVSEIYSVLLRALSDARKTIPSIEVILRHTSYGMTDSTFYVSPEDTALQAVLEDLQTLLLTVSLSHRNGSTFPIDYDSNEAPNMPPLLIKHLSYTKNLKHLRVNFAGHDIRGIKWLMKSLATTSDILPNLERLEFGKMELDPTLLADLIPRFSTSLKHLTLWDIELGYQYAKHWFDSEDRYHPWPPLLRAISKMPKLESLMVGRISHAANGRNSMSIGLEGNKPSQECKGDMKVEIPKLIAGFQVDWPQPLVIPSDDENDEDEDEDEDEDMDDE
ncbi:hypothetical protein DM02DRAFT_568879 [Periconia macrospinosa]|uniref:F-box domain-containing protein n=1 Tax=Periconia macrospinosa TaxID=97972 RepID=A0A2V1DFF8_9PLEO|nr:hypothetical protein DM02DRAFT_568879 [Periconia macrospinosa]